MEEKLKELVQKYENQEWFKGGRIDFQISWQHYYTHESQAPHIDVDSVKVSGIKDGWIYGSREIDEEDFSFFAYQIPKKVYQLLGKVCECKQPYATAHLPVRKEDVEKAEAKLQIMKEFCV